MCVSTCEHKLWHKLWYEQTMYFMPHTPCTVFAGQAAEAMGRVPVWPDMPCSAGWIADRGPEHASMLPLDIRTVRRGARLLN